MNFRNFVAELKRRHVYQVSAAYAVAAWLLIQIATQVFPFFAVPEWVVRLIILLLILGFPIAVVCSWAFEITPDGIKREGELSPRSTRATGRKLAALIVVLAAAAVGLFVFRLVHSQKAVEKKKPEALAVEIDHKSIAVLPFGNLSEDKANAYFVSGMRDEILTSLAQLRDLKVRSRTSTDKYRGDPGNPGALGRELGVASLLEGSVQKAGDEVLINVQLIEAHSGKHLWGQSYRQNVRDIFGVQGQVAQQVAEALRIKLAPAQERRLLVPPTTNVRAHDLYLRGHALGAHADEKSLEGKIALLQEAVAEDPHYAVAWGDLAGAYLTIADAYRAPRDFLDRIRHAALMSVRNDDTAGVGHIWLGAVSMLYDRNFPLAKRELERAVAL